VNHLSGWPRGGFVGVDVFFVVSGFLITGLLLRERESTGRISYAKFYRRRARRILPAAAVVIAATVAATFYLYNSSRGNGVATDGFWALLFVSNWRFAIIGTDYWQINLTSPLQHFWSLAVEEQFYLVWPWVILLLLAGPLRRDRLLAPTIGLVALASFAYSLWHTQAHPTWAYFSTFDRVWELAVGAVLAVLAGRLTEIPLMIRTVLGWVGLIGIVLSFFVIGPDVSFPAPWAALPVVSTALVIAAGVGGDQRWVFPLVNPVATYIGDISYSLYLWHFPPIILLKAYYPDGGALYAVLALGLAAGLSVASFHFLEEPVRTSNWLEPKSSLSTPSGRSGRSGLSVRSGRPFTPDVSSLTLPLLAVVTIAAVTLSTGVLVRQHELSNRVAAVGQVQSSLEQADSADAEPLTPHEQQIANAVAAEEFPEFNPAIGGLNVNAWQADMESKFGCDYVTEENYESCSVGPDDATKTAVMMGDSYALAYLPTVVSSLVPKGWRVQNLTKPLCPTWDVPVLVLGGGNEYEECAQHRTWANSVVAQQKPDLAVLVSTYGTVAHLSSGAKGFDAADEAKVGLMRQIEAIKGSVKRVVVLEPPHPTPALQECVTNVGEPLDCVDVIDNEFLYAEQAERQAARATGATFVSTIGWFCDRDGICPGFVGNTPMRVDGNHLTIEYSQSLAPLLTEALQ
jgi:peptidoglycan/LPS O-acetylase OafA/YrhL